MVKGKSLPIQIFRPEMQGAETRTRIQVIATLAGQRLDPGQRASRSRRPGSIVFGSLEAVSSMLRLVPDKAMPAPRAKDTKSPSKSDGPAESPGSRSPEPKKLISKAELKKVVEASPAPSDHKKKGFFSKITKSSLSPKVELPPPEISKSISEVKEEHSPGDLPAIQSFRVHLPEDAGHYTITCNGMTNMYHAKDKIFQHLMKRGLLSPQSRREDFIFNVQGIDMLIRNESISLDILATLISQVSEINLSCVDLEIKPRASNAPENGDICGVMSHTSDDQFQIHEKIATVIHSLLSRKEGRTVVIEGEMGYGKTRILQKMIIDVAPALVFSTCANPFERVSLDVAYQRRAKNPYAPCGLMAVWREILYRMIDMDIDTQSAHEGIISAYQKRSAQSMVSEDMESVLDAESLECRSIEAESAAMRESRRQWLLSRKFTTPEILQFLPALDDILGLGFSDNEYTKPLTREQRVKKAIDVFVLLLQYFAKTSGVIIVIDNAIFLDAPSWNLVKRITEDVARTGFGVALVLATRPMNNSYMGALSIHIPPEYVELVASASSKVEFIELHPLSKEIIYKIACSCLEVSDLPVSLSQVLLQRSQGNPLVVKELIYYLQRKELIYVDLESQKVRLSDSFKDLTDVPLPLSLTSSLGCRLDRLSHPQQMILKVASLTGQEFSYGIVNGAYPLKIESEKFAEEIRGLCSLHILHQVNDFSLKDLDSSIISGKAGYTDYTVFAFSDGFMRDVILSRLLETQKAFLLKRITEQKDKDATLKHGEDQEYMDGPILWESFMLVRKDFEGGESKKLIGIRTEWKSRWCVLRENSLTFHYDQSNSKILGVVFLKGASATTADPEEVQKENVVRIEALTWIKKEESFRKKRYFYMAAPDLETARSLAFTLTNLISKQYSVTEKRNLIRSSRDKTHSRASSKVDKDFCEFSDISLLILL